MDVIFDLKDRKTVSYEDLHGLTVKVMPDINYGTPKVRPNLEAAISRFYDSLSENATVVTELGSIVGTDLDDLAYAEKRLYEMGKIGRDNVVCLRVKIESPDGKQAPQVGNALYFARASKLPKSKL